MMYEHIFKYTIHSILQQNKLTSFRSSGSSPEFKIEIVDLKKKIIKFVYNLN